MIEASLFVHSIQKFAEGIRNAGALIDQKRKIGTVIALCNGIIAIEMMLFNYGFEQSREFSLRGAKCLTQPESDEILRRVRNPNEGPLNDYIKAGAAVRLVYLSESSAASARNYRDRLLSLGADVSSAPADGIIKEGLVNSCRVDVRYPRR